MVTRAVLERQLLLFFLILLPGCRASAKTPLEALLAPSAEVQEVQVVERLTVGEKQFLLFYYTDKEGQRWLSVGEVQLAGGQGSPELVHRYSALQVREDCLAPCTTYDVAQDPAGRRVLLYGFVRDPATTAIAIDLSDGRTLTSTISERAFISVWSGGGTDPGDLAVLHQKLRELHE